MPFVRIVSCNPLEIKDPNVPPTFSGYPAADPAEWEAFRDEYDRVHRPMWEDFNDWVTEQGAPPLPDLEFIHEGTVNLYVYPEVVDYTDRPAARAHLAPARLLGAGDRRDVQAARRARRAQRSAHLLLARLARLGGRDR